MDRIDTTQRLARLRNLMREHNLDVYIVPSEDSHASEYIAPCDARREYISGFSGSAGCAVVTQNMAALATDGRYFNQAAQQLDQNWSLLKQGLPEVPTWQDWAASQASPELLVGVDPSVISALEAWSLRDKIKAQGGGDLLPIEANLVDEIWGSERPPRPHRPIVQLEQQYTGKHVKCKITELRQELNKHGSRGIVISTLDEIAWLFNMRGSDIPYNPVFFSYAIVTMDTVTIYVDSESLGSHERSFCHENGIAVRSYEQILDSCTTLQKIGTPGEHGTDHGRAAKITITSKASWALQRALGGSEFVEAGRPFLSDSKAIKNATELKGIRACHIRDGCALIDFFAWLEDQLLVQNKRIDEVSAADKLEQLRSQKEHFRGLSFPTISSSGSNAAIIHYTPQKGHCAFIDSTKIYLCDSGAQYSDGTTDTTRTIHFGQPTAMERKAYTLVLKGHIAIDTMVFPEGTNGYQLDPFARKALWMQGLDYRHGTGHGVGAYLNVHEGPIGMGVRTQLTESPLTAGHVLSNEPGYYEDGSFGIRLENIVLVKEVQTMHEFGGRRFFGFEHVTMVPFCRKLIDEQLLTREERKWVDEYHQEVLARTESFFAQGSLALAWLKRETSPLISN